MVIITQQKSIAGFSSLLFSINALNIMHAYHLMVTTFTREPGYYSTYQCLVHLTVHHQASVQSDIDYDIDIGLQATTTVNNMHN